MCECVARQPWTPTARTDDRERRQGSHSRTDSADAMPALLRGVLLAVLATCSVTTSLASSAKEYPAKSGIRTWVDPETPEDRQSYISSRGRRWDLVMSDEFNIPDRDFRPGKDHLWTSLEKPDGVNGALELYSHNMTSTKCDADGTCYFYIKIQDEFTVVHVYNQYLVPPGYQDVEFYYRAAMVQSWNKFCFQGGMIEVRVQLPGAVSKKSGNPDVAKGPSTKLTDNDYYPTWPGIWMMGNLGRAIFSASTNRMWPYSYDRCEPEVFNSTKNQRISACNSNPGYGLNPNQGRGAPEIDLLEGGGKAISSSLQIGPGMPRDFRMIQPSNLTDPNLFCFYSNECKTLGANAPGVPASVYNARGHPSWYQGLRYASNPFCTSDAKEKQDYTTVYNSVSKGIKVNMCDLQSCPGSRDGNADLGLIDGNGTYHWGINYNGTCFPVMNAYTGAYLCDPDNQDPLCEKPRPDSQKPSGVMKEFNYQMDAISSNWPVHVGAYTDYLVYQIEWVTGSNGYVRWMLAGNPIFEVTADAFENVPQDRKQSNPRKKMLDEPMYMIFNVALSSTWGAHPIYTKSVCRGDGTNDKANRICDEYPMYLKVDYIRLYQDLGNDLESDNLMQVGCSPETHPTKEWIEGHLDEYQDSDNMWVEVAGGAFCSKNEDCTVSATGDIQYVSLTTGKCVDKRCVCTHSDSWGGPRCTTALTASSTSSKVSGFGPPMGVALFFAALIIVATSIAVWMSTKKSAANAKAQLAFGIAGKKAAVLNQSPNDAPATAAAGGSTDYSRNFV